MSEDSFSGNQYNNKPTVKLTKHELLKICKEIKTKALYTYNTDKYFSDLISIDAGLTPNISLTKDELESVNSAVEIVDSALEKVFSSIDYKQKDSVLASNIIQRIKEQIEERKDIDTSRNPNDDTSPASKPNTSIQTVLKGWSKEDNKAITDTMTQVSEILSGQKPNQKKLKSYVEGLDLPPTNNNKGRAG